MKKIISQRDDYEAMKMKFINIEVECDKCGKWFTTTHEHLDKCIDDGEIICFRCKMLN